MMGYYSHGPVHLFRIVAQAKVKKTKDSIQKHGRAKIRGSRAYPMQNKGFYPFLDYFGIKTLGIFSGKRIEI